MYTSYGAQLRTFTGRNTSEARERILLGAALADLRETLFQHHCLLETLIDHLVDQGVVDEDQLRSDTAATTSIWPHNEPGSP